MDKVKDLWVKDKWWYERKLELEYFVLEEFETEAAGGTYEECAEEDLR